MFNTILGVSLDFGNYDFQSNALAILYILCGLGIFLYGINMMGSSLKAIAGGKMKVIIEKSTNTPIKGMLVGFIVTMLTQSASGTSALAVSLVAAGLMSFPQALGVLLGANIGGTILTIILAAFSQFKIMPVVSVALVFIGAAMTFFFKQKKVNQIGSVVLGFGFIFLGLAFIDMSFKHFISSASPYREGIVDLFQNLSKVPVLGVIVGTLFTFVVQSSSATIGIVQSMYTVASINLDGALALMLGANIGTTITALLASLGSSRSAKKVAIANILIKFIGVVIFTAAFWPYSKLVELLNNALGWENNPMIIAIAHLAFNIINSFVFLIFVKQFAKLCDKLVKDKSTESALEQSLRDYTLIKKSPALALQFVKTAVDHMSDVVNEYASLAKAYCFENVEGTVAKTLALEDELDRLEYKIHDYLIQITLVGVSKDQSNVLSKYLDTIKDLERIGDHLTNIVEYFETRHKEGLKLSPDGTAELDKMFSTVNDMIINATDAVSNWSKDSAKLVVMSEQSVDDMEETFRKRHVLRLNEGVCKVSNFDFYVDILSDLERIGDHTNNMAKNVINDMFLGTPYLTSKIIVEEQAK